MHRCLLSKTSPQHGLKITVAGKTTSIPVSGLFKERNRSHSFEVMHIKEIIKTNHVQLKSRISCQWFI